MPHWLHPLMRYLIECPRCGYGGDAPQATDLTRMQTCLFVASLFGILLLLDLGLGEGSAAALVTGFVLTFAAICFYWLNAGARCPRCNLRVRNDIVGRTRVWPK